MVGSEAEGCKDSSFSPWTCALDRPRVRKRVRAGWVPAQTGRCDQICATIAHVGVMMGRPAGRICPGAGSTGVFGAAQGLPLAGQMRIRPENRMKTESVVLMANPVQFIQQTRAEIGKIVWPSRREVLLTTVTVFIMAALTATFFALVDILIRGGLQGLLSYFG
ncbi:preprotein translocase subunit SecE [Citreicella sp. 357]|nr:preprotein translocase subunit SecE [Citreicella sp. 357]